MCLPISQTEEKTVKKLLLLVAVLAVVLPEATSAVTNNKSSSYKTNGVSLEMFDPAGSVYQQGESVRFAVRSDLDAYVVVFNIDTEGYVHLLYPRNSKSIQSLVGGVSYSIPMDTDMDLLVAGKTGFEFVFAVSISDRSVINTDQLATHFWPRIVLLTVSSVGLRIPRTNQSPIRISTSMRLSITRGICVSSAKRRARTLILSTTIGSRRRPSTAQTA